ncbi:MAG: hypothetical protein AB7J35_16165 [Dehalococcoidia bacterium]
MTNNFFDGRFRRLVNTAAEQKGSIHDDAEARRLGFRGGFVPGSVVGQSAFPAIVEAFGKEWFEGGWYSLTFVSPVYIDDEVHEVAQRTSDGIAVQVVDRFGRLCCNGRAGLGANVPWDESQDLAHGAEGVLPGIERGFAWLPHDFTPARDLCLGTVNSAGDETAWYRDASPWGGPIVPPEYLQVVALHLMREPHQPKKAPLQGVHGPGMWAQHDLALSEPIFQDRSYRVLEQVADKGRSGRTVFLTYEFEVFEGDRRVGHGRHKAKWLAD